MPPRSIVLLVAIGSCLTGLALGQQAAPVADPPLVNWTAPPYWSPTLARTQPEPGPIEVHALDLVVSLPSSPVPFIAIAPCRIVDTRVAVSDGLHQPNFADGETRTFNFPASSGCPGLPADSVAYSVNVQYRPLTQQGYITLFPTGTTMPSVSTLIGNAASWTTDAAIVPAGTSGEIDVYCQYAGRVVIDINGYYEPEDIVNTLNGLTGDVTLSPGSNVTITPSGRTLTIAATAGPGGVLPTGTTGQTLYNNGSAWTASSVLTNDGVSVVGIGGVLNLPWTSSSSVGVIRFGGFPVMHAYHGPGSEGANFFVGPSAGNFTMGWASDISEGSYNTGVGFGSLYSNTTGRHNTAVGDSSLYANTSGFANTALGSGSLGANNSGNSNTAVGSYTLKSNTSGSENSASGTGSLYWNTTGSDNTASGAFSLSNNSTASGNTATGASSLQYNTTGSGNTATGASSLQNNRTANRNTAMGASALQTQSFNNSNTPWDTSNTAVGFQALYSNQPVDTTTGKNNVAVGDGSLYSNVTGVSNTATGTSALQSNTTGSGNTGVGYQSLYSNGNAYDNTAVGGNSLVSVTSGHDNTAIGLNAGTVNQTGSYNVFLGAMAGHYETGSSTLYIASADTPTLIYGRFDTYQVGINIVTTSTTPTLGATLDVNGQIRARTWTGSSATSVCRDANGVLVPCSSDDRLKTNVVPLAEEKDVMAVLSALRGVAFDWDRSNPNAANAGTGREIGFIAQEVEAVLPEVVHVEDDGYRSMDYAKLSSLLVEVAKAQQREIQSLNARLSERDVQLERRLAALERAQP